MDIPVVGKFIEWNTLFPRRLFSLTGQGTVVQNHPDNFRYDIMYAIVGYSESPAKADPMTTLHVTVSFAKDGAGHSESTGNVSGLSVFTRQ